MKSTKYNLKPDFAFPMTSKIKTLDKSGIEGTSIRKIDLLEAMFAASKTAWEKAINPKMESIRKGGVRKSSLKGGGVDFFTKADTESEKVIKSELAKRFGNN